MTTPQARLALALLLLVLPSLIAAAPSGELAATWGDTLQVPGGELRGLAWLDDVTRVALVVEPDTLPLMPPLSSTLVWYDAQDALIRAEDFTGTLSRGLAFDGKYLWSLGDATPEAEAALYKIESDTLFVDAVFPTPGHRPSDLAWDGRYVWLVDRDRGRLDSFDPETETITRSVLTPAFSPCGLTWDGRDLWTCDAGTGRLYRHASGGGTWSGTVARENFDFRGVDAILAWDGVSLWTVPQPGGTAFALQVHRRER